MKNHPTALRIRWPGVVFMFSVFNRDSRELLVLAVALSVLLAQDKSEAEIGKMAAFFTIVGDILALFALQPGLFSCCKELCSPEPSPQEECGEEQDNEPDQCSK